MRSFSPFTGALSTAIWLGIPACDSDLNIRVISKVVTMMASATGGMLAVWQPTHSGLNPFLHLTTI